MKSTPLIINWHDQNAPIYSAHFEHHGKGRLATAGGDNNVRVDGDGENRRVEYLATLAKHTQAVNVVRWSPKGELLASGGDDGNVILWVPSETHHPTFGNDGIEDKESWRTKHMCRSSGAEIYDLAWSPDGAYFIIGSMDNIARIYNAATGVLVRQIAEHSHYVQGVAWDPLNEFIATQSSDRSVHIYSLRSKDGQYILAAGLDDKAAKIASHFKADLPPRRISQSPAPSEPSTGVPLAAATTSSAAVSAAASASAASINLHGHRAQLAVIDAVAGIGPGPMSSPAPSAPGTPTSVALPMNPPSVVSHSRRSSFSSRRSVSPAPSTMPLPAVMPMEASPKPHLPLGFGMASGAGGSSGLALGLGMKNANLYANETLTSFFRRLTFTPDGSLLLTPAGQYQTQHQHHDGAKPSYEIINTVYIYSRGGISKAPIAHLPGHKKPSVAVRCSPIIYTLRPSPPTTKHITIDTSSAEEPIIPLLPDPISSNPTSAPSLPSSSLSSSSSVMDPPPPPTTDHSTAASASATPAAATSGPKSAFALSYRMIYAVATQDSVLLYDTQQQTPLCIVSNLHCATFTDLAWSSDGLTLLISSSDGFCSTLSFTPGELGQPHTGETALNRDRTRLVAGESATPTAASPSFSASAATPASIFAPPSPYPNNLSGSGHQHRNSASSFTAPSPPPTASFVSSITSGVSGASGAGSNGGTGGPSFVPLRPSSPARSNSASSILTMASTSPAIATGASTVAGGMSPADPAALLSSSASLGNNPPLVVGSLPSLSASTGKTVSVLAAAAAAAAASTSTPPGTPRHRASSVASSVAGSVAGSVVGSVVGSAAGTAVSVPGSLAGTKREAAAASESDREDATPVTASSATAATAANGAEREPKKRRIAPTLVSNGEGSR